MCTNTTTGTLLIQLLRYQTFDTKINNLNLKIYIKIWNTHFFQWQHSALCPNKVLVPPQQVLCSHWWLLLQHLMNLREKKRKCISKCTSFRQSFYCVCCYLPLGALGSGRLAPILSICLCEVVMTCLVLSTARVPDCHDSLDCISVLKSHTTPSLGVLEFYPFLCPPPALFLSTLVRSVYTCMFVTQTPPSLTH